MNEGDVELADKSIRLEAGGPPLSSFRDVNKMTAMDNPHMIGSIISMDSVGDSRHSLVGAARSLVSSVRNSVDGSVRESATKIQPEDGEADYYGPARVSEWYHTSFNIIADIMGTGVLSLPSTVAGLGYTLGTIAIVTFAFAVYYSGFILLKVKNKYYKQVLSYGDLAFILHGRPFETFVRWLLYANWYSLMCYYILALTSSLMSAFYWTDGFCFWMWGLISVVVLLPFIQLRTFHAISYVSFISLLAILAAIAIIVASFIMGDSEEAKSADFIPPTWKVPPQSFLTGFSALSNIIFSFQGQSMFYELAAEMKNPRTFPLSLGVAQTIMGSMYLFTALLAYTYGGQNVSGFILYSLPENKLRTACSLLIFFHILIAYLITGQPLIYKFHEFVSKKTVYASGVKPSLIHFGITLMFMLFGFIIANLIPFFSDMQGIIAAFAASPIVFFFPAYFYMRSSMRAGDWGKVPIYEKAWLLAMIFVIFPFCLFVGLASSISGIAESWSGAGTPFACLVASQL